MILYLSGPLQKQASLTKQVVGLAGVGAAAGASSSKKGERLKNGAIWGAAGALGPLVTHHAPILKKVAHTRSRP